MNTKLTTLATAVAIILVLAAGPAANAELAPTPKNSTKFFLQVTEEGEIYREPSSDVIAKKFLCAIGHVEQGAAHAVNSDCILLPGEVACMDWSYRFAYITGGGYIASLGAQFAFPLYFDIIPDAGRTIDDVMDTADDAALVIPSPPGHGGDAEKPRNEVAEDEDRWCHKPLIGLYDSTAIAAGWFRQNYCNLEGECSVLESVPYNEDKIPGQVLALS